jgi:para-aminobenzoate synthetase component 1
VQNTFESFTNIRGIDAIIACSIDNLNLHYSEQLFKQLANKPWAMWLDSSDSDHIDSHFDIMVWQPEITLSTTGLHTKITHIDTGNSIDSTDDPLELLKKSIGLLFTNSVLPEQDLPFKGGALGCFAYDLGRRFENIPERANSDIQQADMAIGLYSHAIIYDRKKQSFTLISRPEKQQSLLNEIDQLLTKTLVTTILSSTFSLQSDWQANMTKNQYQEKFEQVQQYLLSGDCYQINLAQRFTAQYKGDEFCAYQSLRKHNKAPFSAFIRLEKSCVLSISPERFLQVKGKKVQTKPIKGTRPRHHNPIIDQHNAQQLQAATKDRAENLMIVDLLRNDLSKVCQPGSVQVPELFAIESFPAVHHLVSTVVGELEDQFDAIDLLTSAFPGGSITGAPKIRAMEIIEELEPHRRNLYCGSIGYISACGNMDTSITIRSLICENNHIHCWAGGGLVADSNIHSEYQETLDKVNKILPILSNLNIK